MRSAEPRTGDSAIAAGAEGLLRAALDSLPDGVLVLDERGRVATYNRRFAEIWDVSSGEESDTTADLERAAAKLVDPAVLEGGTTNLWRKSSGGAPFDLALLDGRILEIRTSPMTSADASNTVITVRDMTSTRRDEAIRRRAAATFDEVLERWPDSVLVSRNWRVLYANPALVTLLGHASKEDLLGAPTTSLWAAGDVPAIASRVKALYGRPKGASLEARRFMRKDGKVVEVEVAALAIDWEGAPAMMLMARDISERERLIARLVESDRLASLGALAASVSHEVNNPLACILGNLDGIARMHALLSRDRADGEKTSAHLESSSEMLALARDSAERMRAFVADLRTFSRGDDDAQLCDIAQTIEAALHVAGAEIASRAELSVDLAEMPLVRGSQGRLAQLFVQLILRAARSFPPEARARAHIVVRGSTTAEGDVRIEVTDNGPEITRATSPMFAAGSWPDHQASALLVADGIATSLRGRLDAVSSATGTIVIVRLPPAFAAESATGKRAALRQPPITEPEAPAEASIRRS